MNLDEFELICKEVVLIPHKVRIYPAIGGRVSPEDYEKIEFVFDHYPKMNKVLIAILYKQCGMCMINDMYPRAKKLFILNRQIEEQKRALKHYEESGNEWNIKRAKIELEELLEDEVKLLNECGGHTNE